VEFLFIEGAQSNGTPPEQDILQLKAEWRGNDLDANDSNGRERERNGDKSKTRRMEEESEEMKTEEWKKMNQY
jgi:hypothetical protein